LRDLAVTPRQVVDTEEAAERRVAAEGRRTTLTVLVEESGKYGGALCARAIEPRVGPALLERLDEALGLAVGARGVWPGPPVFEISAPGAGSTSLRAAACRGRWRGVPRWQPRLLAAIND